MSAVGRNDPCPCRSGLKYKKCCLARTAPVTGAYTAGERQSALEALMRFSARAEFESDDRLARLAFWPRALDRLPDEEARRVMGLEESHVAYQEWFAFDFRLGNGWTITDIFLQRHGDRLRSGERRYLERMRLSHLRLYEVAAVRLDEGLDLTDLWAGRRIRVRERLGTRQLVRWDLLAARVVLGPEGVPVLDGAPYLYPASAKEEILKGLRRARRAYRERASSDDLTGFFKWAGALYHDFWLKHVVLRPAPKILTAEGDEMVFARVVFQVRDPEALTRALSSDPDLERQDDGSFVWLEPVAGFHRGLGTFVLEGGRVVFEATSKPRAERGRRMLEALAGDTVRYRATSYEDVARAMKRTPPEREEPEVPPEVEAELVGQFYEQHYRRWPDQPLPALGGRTPREAARLKSGRARVILLLKEMENLAERQRLEGRPAYDFGWLWGELGLERPG